MLLDIPAVHISLYCTAQDLNAAVANLIASNSLPMDFSIQEKSLLNYPYSRTVSR
ncbi:unnamed protein product [Brugia timori]|uniref:D-lactate dehydrogenase n=1 Tax=Brugia timori TaxID=42155 RepID=A0A0R3QLY9_9BILA|nr:unnamed protein product [Brugia timori]